MIYVATRNIGNGTRTGIISGLRFGLFSLVPWLTFW